MVCHNTSLGVGLGAAILTLPAVAAFVLNKLMYYSAPHSRYAESPLTVTGIDTLGKTRS
jgi:hypothetical protein